MFTMVLRLRYRPIRYDGNFRRGFTENIHERRERHRTNDRANHFFLSSVTATELFSVRLGRRIPRRERFQILSSSDDRMFLSLDPIDDPGPIFREQQQRVQRLLRSSRRSRRFIASMVSNSNLNALPSLNFGFSLLVRRSVSSVRETINADEETINRAHAYEPVLFFSLSLLVK